MSYHIRQAEPRDVPAIAEQHRLQNERDGTKYPMPELFDGRGRLMPNIALALAICDGEEVRQGVWFEKGLEMLLAGCDPKATAQLHKEIENVWYLLRKQGYTGVHCFVPKQVVLPVEKPLKKVGFERDDFRLAHLFKDLTVTEEEK